MSTRRTFLKTAALALLPACKREPATRPPEPKSPPRPLDLLVLGGTGFIGPYIVRHAVSRGHRVSIFTRGRRDAELPPEVVRLIGDRDGQLGALAGKRFDAVFDNNTSKPHFVQATTELLRDSGRYMFTSSTGVYYPYLRRGVDESTPVRLEVTDPNDGSEAYGVAKANCEKLVLDRFGARGVVVRPTYIVGPGDPTDRFPYWPVRLARGGEVLAPGRRADPVQLIDVRDLAEFMVKLIEDGRDGIYNAAGPREPLTIEGFLEQARAAVNPAAKLTWIEDYVFLEAHEIVDSVPWVLLKGNDEGHTSARNDRAIAAGLTFRPVEDSVRDTLAWWPSVPAERRDKPEFSITPEKEARALADWHALSKKTG
jgi:2'-hydroxyisoflavone reductase